MFRATPPQEVTNNGIYIVTSFTPSNVTRDVRIEHYKKGLLQTVSADLVSLN